MPALFVYGTLMRGERAHALMRGARWIVAARTSPAFELVDAGGYPGLVTGGRRSVAGEIYAVGTHLFDVLDAYEDVGLALYRRVRIVVAGRPVTTYAMPPDRARGLPRIRSGDWRLRV